MTDLETALALARELAWSSWSNLYGLPYYQRRELVRRLRGALLALEGADSTVAPTRAGAEPRKPKVAA